MLQLVAEHADIWNVPGPPHGSLEFLAERSAVLDQRCAAIGRDPASVLRSVQLIVGADDPAGVRRVVGQVIEAGFGHVVIGVRPPAPENVPRWLADEVIAPLRARLDPVGSVGSAG